MTLAVFKIALGTLPDWLGAIGTVASVLLIGLGLLREIKRRRLDDEQVAAERRDAEASQARLVTTDLKINVDRRTGEIVINNDSPAPILSVIPALLLGPPRGKRRRFPFPLSSARIAPNSDAMVVFTLPEGSSIGNGLWDVDLELLFVDAEGRAWRRQSDDLPERLLEDYRVPKIRKSSG